jgi:hypothetical protein
MFAPPSGTASPRSVAGSPANARDGTWQVPHDWRPEADKTVSKNNALPATAATEGPAGVEAEMEPAPPALHAVSAVVIAHEAAIRAVFRYESDCFCPYFNAKTNLIENDSYLQVAHIKARLRGLVQ